MGYIFMGFIFILYKQKWMPDLKVLDYISLDFLILKLD